VREDQKIADVTMKTVETELAAIQSCVYETHLISLLLAAKTNKNVLTGYACLAKDKKLFRVFTSLLHGNGKCKASIEGNAKYFTALASIPNLKLRIDYLRKRAIRKGPINKLFKAIQSSYQDRFSQASEDVPSECAICKTKCAVLYRGCDGGLCSRNVTALLDVCETCNNFLALLSVREIHDARRSHNL
jgi:hypothetical protein